jgi:hypothetical protein
MWIIANTESSGPAPLRVTCYCQYLFFAETTTDRNTGPGGGAAIDVTSSSTSVVAAAGNTSSTPRGSVIDVFFNFGGGYYWEYR